MTRKDGTRKKGPNCFLNIQSIHLTRSYRLNNGRLKVNPRRLFKYDVKTFYKNMALNDFM